MEKWNSVFEEIREKLPLVDVVSKYTRLSPVGERLRGLCPLHDEDTPSFFVNTEYNTYYCFGCKSGGTVIDFIAEKERIPIREVPNYVEEVYGIKLESKKQESAEHKEEREKHKSILRMFFEYHNKPKTKEKAVDYLSTRFPKVKREKIEELVYALDIFFVPRNTNFPNILDEKILEDALKYDIVRRSKRTGRLYTPFSDRVIFPVFQYKTLVGFNGRAVDDSIEPKYLLSKKGFLFEKSATLWGFDYAKEVAKKKGIKRVILVEGVMDAIALLLNDEPAVAYLGSSVSQRQWNFVLAFDSVVLIPDMDEAGIKGSVKSIEEAMKVNFSPAGQVVLLPREFKDVVDFLNEKPLYELRKQRTRSFEDFYIDFFVVKAKRSVFNENDVDSIRSAFLSLILPTLVEVKHSPLASSIIAQIAYRLKVSPSYVYARLDKGIKVAKEVVAKKERIPEKALENVTPVEIRLMSIVKNKPELSEQVIEKPWFHLLDKLTQDFIESVNFAWKNNKRFSEVFFDKIGNSNHVYYLVFTILPSIKHGDLDYEWKEISRVLDDRYKAVEGESTVRVISKFLEKRLKPPTKIELEKAKSRAKPSKEHYKELREIKEKVVEKFMKTMII